MRPLRWAERVAVSTLRAQLNMLDPTRTGALQTIPTPAEVGAGDAQLPAHMLEELLARSLEQSARGGQGELYAKLLQELVPDEARILASLSDGSSAALVHIKSRLGDARRALQNASSVGRTAGLTVPHLTPIYVSHLLRLGLVETGPEDTDVRLEYDTLIAERVVREAMKQAEVGPLPPRVIRRTLRLSALGRELWEACGSTSP